LARANMNAVTGAPAQSVGAGHGRGGAHTSGVRKARGFTLGRRQQVAAWLFLTPAILYVLFAFALPIVYNVMLSFEQTSPATIADITPRSPGSQTTASSLMTPQAGPPLSTPSSSPSGRSSASS